MPGNSMVDQKNKDATELAQALQCQIELAKGLSLDFAARLLAMALMEIRINLNQISLSEVEELCARIEHQCGGRAEKRSGEYRARSVVGRRGRFVAVLMPRSISPSRNPA